MLVDLRLAITYLGTVLIRDPYSGLWVVLLMEWVAKYDLYVLWDLNETIWLFFITQRVREQMREIYLSVVIRSGVSY